MNKYTKAIPAVRASKLYKSLCRVFRKQDHDELLRQLVWAYVDYRRHRSQKRYPNQASDFDLDGEHLACAFVWELTPQKHDFWRKVDAATYDAGRQP